MDLSAGFGTTQPANTGSLFGPIQQNASTGSSLFTQPGGGCKIENKKL